jgi:hypothetical protein
VERRHRWSPRHSSTLPVRRGLETGALATAPLLDPTETKGGIPEISLVYSTVARPHRLEAQDAALSRPKRGFEFPWGHQLPDMPRRFDHAAFNSDVQLGQRTARSGMVDKQ